MYYKENICFYWLILWHLKQLLCSLTSNISTHLDLLGHLSADTWDLWPLLLDNSVSNSLGNLNISAPVLCCHQRTIFVLPCYSFDYNAELQGEARSHFCITIFLLFISLLFRGVHYGHITCASTMSGVGCQKTSVWWGEEGDCYEDIWAHAVYRSQESLLNIYIYVSKMFCKDFSRSLLMFMFQSLFFTFLEI